MAAGKYSIHLANLRAESRLYDADELIIFLFLSIIVTAALYFPEMHELRQWLVSKNFYLLSSHLCTVCMYSMYIYACGIGAAPLQFFVIECLLLEDSLCIMYMYKNGHSERLLLFRWEYAEVIHQWSVRQSWPPPHRCTHRPLQTLG